MGEKSTMADSSSEGDPKSAKSTKESQSQQQSQQGYPYPPPYPAYPAPPYPGYPPNNNYQYAPPPPPPQGYYPTTAHSFVLIGPPQRSHGYKFARVVLTLMIILFFGMSVMSLLTWLIYGSDIPVFYSESLDMAVFSLNNMALNATWSANVSIRNPSHKYEVSYDYVEAALVYEDHLLDTNYVNPFLLGKEARNSINFRFQMPNSKQQDIVGATWVKDINDERQQRGAISFDMRIIVNAVFRSDDHGTASRTLKVFCGDLEVVFPTPADTAGKLNDGYKECLILSN